jgi:hypothetical protein
MGRTRPIDPDVEQYFAKPSQALHRQYLAMRSFLFEGDTAEGVAAKYGYTVSTVYTIARDFKTRMAECLRMGEDSFFQVLKPGRKTSVRDDDLVQNIVSLRKKHLSIPDIKIFLDGKGYNVSEGFIYRVCDDNGFARLPKRSKWERQELAKSSGYVDVLQAPVSGICTFSEPERFASKGVGILCFLSIIKVYGIDKIIECSAYPGTGQIPKLSSILAFVALKLSNVKRSKALISIQAALVQDPDTGLLCYGDTTVKHDNQDNVILEFLDFYRKGVGQEVNYVVFDSKFTTLGNLGRINKEGIKFITIQRKSKGLNEKIQQIPSSQWQTIKIEKANHKSRTVVYSESTTTNTRYGEGTLRQIFIKGKGIQPATILTNDESGKAGDLIRKYARRWLVETEISGLIDFFHLNRNSSGIVIKVDFDLTMTILAHNLYRLLALELPGYSHKRPQTLFDTFIDNYGDIVVGEEEIIVKMNRKRSLPLLRDGIPRLDVSYPWLGGKRLIFTANSHT